MKLDVAVFNTQPPHLYVGGVERRITEIAQALNPAVKTTIYSGTKNGFNKAVSPPEATIVPCASTDKFFPIDNWTFNRTLSKMVDTVKADVYESHNVSGFGLLKTIKKRNLSSHFIQTIHGPLADEYAQSIMDQSRTFRTMLANQAMGQLAKIEH